VHPGQVSANSKGCHFVIMQLSLFHLVRAEIQQIIKARNAIDNFDTLSHLKQLKELALKSIILDLQP